MSQSPLPAQTNRWPLATVFVWAVFLLAVVALSRMIDRYTGKTPYFDDFAYFGLNLLNKYVQPGDFWIPINEHRVPLPKLVSWATMRVCGYNPRAVMRVDLTLMAVGTAGLMLVARQL